MSTLVIAHELKHAEFVAQRFLNIPRSQLRFVDRSQMLMGIKRGTEVVVVQAPRYAPNQRQRDMRRMLIEIAVIKELKLKYISLK